MSGLTRLVLALAVLAAWGGSALPAGDGRTPVRSGERLDRTVYDLRRDALAPPTTRAAGIDLRAAIEELAGLELRRKAESPAETATTRPAATQPASAPAGAPTGARAPAAGPAGPLTPRLLQRITELRPDEVVSAPSLADALFLAGHLAEARGCYELALKGPADDQAKAWVLFQIANCRRADDPAGAAATYRRLLAEHAGSPWAPVAEVQVRLLEWHQANRPAEQLEAGQ